MNIRRLTAVACGVLTVTAVGTMAKADDWGQWRGPKRDGISQEKRLLKAWPKEGPKLVWQVKNPMLAPRSTTVQPWRGMKSGVGW